MRTVREALQGAAIAQGVSPERFAAFERGWLNNHIDLCVPERYRRLARDVIYRFPEGWDRDVEWYLLSRLPAEAHGYGSVLPLEHEKENDRGQRNWLVVLYAPLLDHLSDPACRWIIAHLLAHVARGLTPTGTVPTGSGGSSEPENTSPSGDARTESDEDAADRLVLDWGFAEELLEFLR